MNKIIISFATVISLFLLTSCPIRTMVESVDAPSQREQIIYAPLAASVAQSSEQAIIAFGKPIQEKNKAIETLHDQQQNQWKELIYSDLELGYFIDPQTRQEVLAYQRIASEKYALKGNLRIGQPLSAFEAALGKPDKLTSQQADFCDRWGRGDCLHLRLQDQEVIALEQVFAMD